MHRSHRHLRRPAALAAVALSLLAGIVAAAPAAAAPAWAPPPVNAGFDYQIGGDYPLPAGVGVVSRDWFSGEAAPDPAYSVCYVNAFQTQSDEPGTDRPDEHSNWPRSLILERLGDDPHWGGEYLVDISSARKRARAADWVGQMIQGCADGGFEAVEFDNLDSWTRFDGTPLAKKVPFGKGEAIDFATLIAARAHSLGLAVGQKNTVELGAAARRRVGFDFAIAEDCARYHECGRYVKAYGDHVIAVEYREPLFERACAEIGDRVSVVLRDRLVSRPGSRNYKFADC
jgi:glycosyl hydrolase family 114